MTPTMVVAWCMFAFTWGVLLGLLIGVRHVEHETERGYLTGYVDGYRKAQDDAGEVPGWDG